MFSSLRNKNLINPYKYPCQRRTKGGCKRAELPPPLGSVNLWFPGGFQAPTVARPPP